MKKHILNIAVIALGLVALSYLPVPGEYQTANISQALEVSSFKFKITGETSGTGTFFEIKDSDYLNVSLQSSETLTLSLSSRPKVISLVIPSSSVSSAKLTINRLTPNMQYFIFDNSYKNETAFNSGAEGSYTFAQNLSGSHHIWIQETKGTIFIPEDCNSVGSFNNATSTCTLNQDILNENIEITQNGITLNCNNHIRSGTRAEFAILLNVRQNVTVRNCVIDNAGIGIFSLFAGNNTFTNNRVSNTSVGISVNLSNNNVLSGNTVSHSSNGILVNNASDNIVDGNTAKLNSSVGIAVVDSLSMTTGNTIKNNLVTDNEFGGVVIDGFRSNSNHISNNTLSGNGNGIFFFNTGNHDITGNTINSNSRGIFLSQAFSNTITDNTMESNQTGLSVDTFTPSATANNKIFHNNFINNVTQTSILVGGPYFFDNGLPDGGNFWSDFDAPAKGCIDANNDKLCDAPRIININRDIKDNFPWTIQNGWKAPKDININLSWSKNQDPDFKSYKIFRETSTGVGLNSTLATTITDQSQTSFNDQNLDAGVIYFYKIFVFDRVGLSSGSNEVSGGL